MFAGSAECVLLYHAVYRAPAIGGTIPQVPSQMNPENVAGTVGYAAWASRYLHEYNASREGFARARGQRPRQLRGQPARRGPRPAQLPGHLLPQVRIVPAIGIGFTWEHDAHLHLKRAKSSELFFGTPAEHRALADLVGI